MTPTARSSSMPLGDLVDRADEPAVAALRDQRLRIVPCVPETATNRRHAIDDVAAVSPTKHAVMTE